ncbi:MAG TPA: methyltransferase domain-containing protein [Anaerolineae bacterium]|nr:methyltransferase domain-containing protein [Anaerolineae bacterium]HIQ04925.1 methyltransferase domain-containing protein [Anaerolineae bacterium]
MDLVDFYDNYWKEKGDRFDHARLDLLANYVGPGERVLALDCGPGVLAQKLQARGATVVGTDMSHTAVEMARAKGVKAYQVDLDVAPLPFPDASFDTVVSDSGLEHRYFHEKALDESVRVLRPGGKYVLLLPNLGHWRCRWWLLRGRFPYVRNAPTDPTHLRFFTLYEARKLLAERGVRTVKTDGSASLWVWGLYLSYFQWPGIRQVYTWLARHWPSLFARDFIIIGRKEYEPNPMLSR